jgi:hypothetical protein
MIVISVGLAGTALAGDEDAGEAEPAPAADDSPAADGAAAAGDADFDPEDPYAGDEIPAHLEYDADGDGKVEADEQALDAEYETAFEGIDEEIAPVEPGAMTFEEMAKAAMSTEEFRNLVRLARAKVLDRLQTKMAKKQDARMATIGRMILYFSFAGVLLLFMPLALRKRYPGKGAMLLRYSALAALTFVVTVNFFGAVVLGMRGAQAGLGELTNPQLKVAEGFFDALHDGADEYAMLGKNLFGPTLEQLTGGGDEQPAVALMANGQKLLADAKVFKTIGNTFEKLDFVFAALPIVLLAVTMILFVLAIKPTLLQIVRMPGMVAAGDVAAGKSAVKDAGRRIFGEVLATLCTIGVLGGLTLFASVVLGRLVQPALDSLIQYFGVAVIYLQVQAGASSGLVFVMLISVILFLALNLAAIILSMALFLGKCQKIFQQRFHDKVPLRAHARFWTWGVPSVLVAMLVPLLYMVLARWGIDKIANAIIGDGEDIKWSLLMLSGPLLLVLGFVAMFWAARGVKALEFLATYRVKDVLAERRAGEPVPLRPAAAA